MPTLADLTRLADAFGVPISLLFSCDLPASPEQGTIVRAGAQRKSGCAKPDLGEEPLAPALGGSFEMRRWLLLPDY